MSGIMVTKIKTLIEPLPAGVFYKEETAVVRNPNYSNANFVI